MPASLADSQAIEGYDMRSGLVTEHQRYARMLLWMYVWRSPGVQVRYPEGALTVRIGPLDRTTVMIAPGMT